MGLSSGTRPLFSARWVAGLTPVAEAGMVATIDIYSEGSRTYNSNTDTWVVTETPHYSGKARVQPVRSSSPLTKPGDGTTIQRVRFQIPVGAVDDLRPDMRVRVTASPLNPALLDYLFVVVDSVDSSNPVEQTFECTVNNETVVV